MFGFGARIAQSSYHLGLRAGRAGVRNPAGAKVSSRLQDAQQLSLLPTQPRVQWKPVYFLGDKSGSKLK